MNNPKLNTVIIGDSEIVLKKFSDNTFDTVITDPPYGLSFMGKKWDYNVPTIELWKEILRVTNLGGTLLCFAGSRTQHRMACNIEDAGWILKDCIMWLYGSGFPKATDISKQIDKRAGVEREITGSRNPHIDGRIRKQFGVRNDNIYKRGDSGKLTELSNGKLPITAPATPEAQLWDGWKSHGLKPAYEPIIVAMKPNDGSYAENALKHGVSGLNIDGGRIETNEEIGCDNTGIKESISQIPKDKSAIRPHRSIKSYNLAKKSIKTPSGVVNEEDINNVMNDKKSLLETLLKVASLSVASLLHEKRPFP